MAHAMSQMGTIPVGINDLVYSKQLSYRQMPHPIPNALKYG
jgi:hypothetical protein